MKAVLADTGPLYALADPSDQFHARARAEIESIEKRGLQVAAGYPVLCVRPVRPVVGIRRYGMATSHHQLGAITNGIVYFLLPISAARS